MRRLLVVGASSGIGQDVFNMAADVSGGWEAVSLPAGQDVREWSAVQNYLTKQGPFDGVAYCAGINRLAWVKQVARHDFKDVLEVNVGGFIGLVRGLTRTQGGGRIVVVGSDAAFRPMRTSMVYCASKAALHSAAAVAARELAPDWSVNVVAPGMTEPTNMQKYVDEVVPLLRKWKPDQARQYELSQIPMGRRAAAEEVAQVILSTLDLPMYVTGTTITVNGGR